MKNRNVVISTLVVILALAAWYYFDTRKSVVISTLEEESEIEEVQEKLREDKQVEENILVAVEDNDRSISPTVMALINISEYTEISTTEFESFDACFQSKLHEDSRTAKKMNLYTSDRFGVTVYATPNKEQYTSEDFFESKYCGELGAKIPLAIVDGYQLWWSQLDCGFEVGEGFGNETDESKLCSAIADELLAFRVAQLN